MATIIEPEEPVRRVFISYSTSDRPRVDGLERLLVLFGHKVFLDFKQIRLGSRWKDEIACALDHTDVTLVYWTRSAASSRWVRDEYEYFLAQHPSRPLVPIVGDETPLPDPLKERQAMDLMYRAGGTTSNQRSHPLARTWRDLQVAGQAASVMPEWYALAGQAFLGLDPGPRLS